MHFDLYYSGHCNELLFTFGKYGMKTLIPSDSEISRMYFRLCSEEKLNCQIA